jgi:nicotinate dehydrogenase subunit B
MSISRRQFLETLGHSCLLYAFRFTPGAGTPTIRQDPLRDYAKDFECMSISPDIDFKDWIVFDENDNVMIFTGRTELGQGLKTVLTAIVTQGLEIPIEKLTVIMGDTDFCPDDGPTTGSCATREVGWGFWLACMEIRKDMVLRAARLRGLQAEDFEFRQGGIRYKKNPDMSIKPAELSSSDVVLMTIDPHDVSPERGEYTDLGLHNVNAKQIVTGRLKYVGDIKLPGTLYADWLTPPYHPLQTGLVSADLEEARAIPGIKMVDVRRGRVAAIGRRYQDVIRALKAAKTKWSLPTRPKELQVEREIRERAKLVEIKEENGDVDMGLRSSFKTVSETYITQYTTWAQIETDIALAKPENNGNEVTVWASCQYPYKVRQLIAGYLNLPESSVHVIGMPVGGGFGGKTVSPVNQEAADLSRIVGTPVKLTYSRKNQFQLRGSYKMACVIDLTTGVGTDGRILARKIDIYQDKGNGTTGTYAIPNVLTQLYESKWPFARAVSRGTSFVQTCFATESHVDMVAAEIGFDPFIFRRINVRFPAFINLIDACAEMISYDKNLPYPDEGIGIAICHHGGKQMGAVSAQVAVDRSTGSIKVKKICGAFDIGTVINRNTATVGIRGAIIWGLGYALSEKVKLDGHSCYTEYLTDYRIPRFLDIPPIEIAFLDNYNPGSPRGCGEMPMIPTIGAIANAVYKAIGIRFYSTPITPDRVREALQRT